MTKEERITAVAMKREKALKLRVDIKKRKRVVSRKLLAEGWRLEYNVFDTFSLASKWDRETGAFIAHFANRAPNDNFSRPIARELLLDRIAGNTHKLIFNFVPVAKSTLSCSETGAKLELQKAMDTNVQSLNKQIFLALLGAELLLETKNHPECFSASTVARTKALRVKEE